MLLLSRLARPLRFAIVGASGVVVNTIVLWSLARGMHVAVWLASVLATEAAIVTNFLLNDRWTFRASRGNDTSVRRFLRFNGVSLGGMAITVGVLSLLTSLTPMHLLIANMLAICVAMVWNYVANSRWTWRPASGGQVISQQADSF